MPPSLQAKHQLVRILNTVIRERETQNTPRMPKKRMRSGSGEYQDNTGGRPRAWLGEEELAEYGEQPTEEAVAEEQIGKEAEEEEDEEEVPLWPQEGLSMSSEKDPITGEFNVETQAKPPTKFQMRGEPGPSKQKQYKESDVPRDVPGLRAFIQLLDQEPRIQSSHL
jgi:hypothetical protein